jgi:hypothetical protein
VYRRAAGAVLMLLHLGRILQILVPHLTKIPARPRLLLEDDIMLEDALGRVLSLPYQHFKFWPVVEARLRCEFAGTPGEALVLNEQFVPLFGNRSTALNFDNWDKAVFPGARLCMAMMSHTTFIDGLPQKGCPKCDNQNESRSDWTKW